MTNIATLAAAAPEPAAKLYKAHIRAAQDFLSLEIGKRWEGTIHMAEKAGYSRNTAEERVYTDTFLGLLDIYSMDVYTDAFGNLTRWSLSDTGRQQIKEHYGIE